MTTLIKGDLYDESEIQSLVPDMQLLYEVGSGNWKDSLFYVPSQDIYIQKGAFGTHDAICYRLSDVTDKESALRWQENTEALWNKHFPNVMKSIDDGQK